MKSAFAKTFTELATADARHVLLTGDYCFGMFDELKQQRPLQYFNCGVCEQSMVGVAAGLAISGFIPWVYAITPFLLERAFEQIKLDISAQKLKAVLVGFDDYANDGPTHNPLNPKSMVTLLDNFHYIQPRDASEVKLYTRQCAGFRQAAFMRLRNAPAWPAEGRDA